MKYELDFDKITTVEDLKLILKYVRLEFEDTPEITVSETSFYKILKEKEVVV